MLTGEGKLDATSFDGKVVGGVLGPRSCGTLVVAGDDRARDRVPGTGVSLVERFGCERAWADPAGCIAEAVEAALPTGRESASPS